MRHKRRRGVNPLREYRRLQREIRVLFDPFTARHCPGCAAPCCIKPTRVTPVDVALALGVGHTFPHLQGRDAYEPALEYAGHRLAPIPLPMSDDNGAPLEYCEYLDKGRCTFPDDLRPFGCTQYVCGPMYAHLPDETLRRLRRLLHQLDDAHTDLLRALRDTGRLPETQELAAPE
jgi:hypothetical protein